MDRNRDLAWKLTACPVALRKESVDRNSRSLFAMFRLIRVALRKESVDRNVDAMQIVVVIMCRSPQGERG